MYGVKMAAILVEIQQDMLFQIPTYLAEKLTVPANNQQLELLLKMTSTCWPSVANDWLQPSTTKCCCSTWGNFSWLIPIQEAGLGGAVSHAAIVSYSQLMQIILIIVRVKKGSGATSTLTKTAVSRKTTRMTTRLPDILSFWGILSEELHLNQPYDIYWQLIMFMFKKVFRERKNDRICSETKKRRVGALLCSSKRNHICQEKNKRKISKKGFLRNEGSILYIVGASTSRTKPFGRDAGWGKDNDGRKWGT